MRKIPLPNNIPCPPLDYDLLNLFSGGDIPVNNNLIIHQPSIVEIRDYGDKNYFKMVSLMCTIPSDMKAELDSIGKCYMEMSDFELFCHLTQELPLEQSRILFGDIDFSKMKVGVNPDNQDMVLYSPETGTRIDRMLYTKLVTYLRRMHGFEYKPEYATNKYTLRALIQEAHTKLERAKKENKPYQSPLADMVISLCCTEEFKYTSQTVMNIGICELIISYQQILKKKSALALLQGSYSGMVDVSKIDKSHFVWTHEAQLMKEMQTQEKSE